MADDLREIFPSAEEHQADPEGVYEQWKGRPKQPEEAFVWPDEGPGFRPAQQRWGAAFPFPGSGALNRICVHPPSSISPSGRSATTTSGSTRPTPAPSTPASPTTSSRCTSTATTRGSRPRASRPGGTSKGFLYLTDVTEDDNPTRLVSVRDTEHIDNPYGVLMPRGNPEVYAAERPALRRPGLLPGLPVGHVPPRRPVRLGHRRPHGGRRRLQERRHRMDRLRHPAEPIDRDGVDRLRRGLDATRAGALRLARSRSPGVDRAPARTDAGALSRPRPRSEVARRWRLNPGA